MPLGPPFARGRVRKIQQAAFARPKLEGIWRTVITPCQIAAGQGFGIIAALPRQIRFLYHHRAEASLVKLRDHFACSWPLLWIECQVSHFTKPEHVQNQRVAGQLAVTKYLCDVLQLLPAAVSIARLQKTQAPTGRQGWI